MKKLNLMLTLLLAFSMLAMAQDKKDNKETKVSKFENGSMLTKDDVSFLNLVNNGDASKTRGAAVKEVKIGGVTFAEGHKLTASDIAAIDKAMKSYAKTNQDAITKEAKNPPKTRGCYYTCYYYYCSNGYCQYYWYCC